MKQSPSRFKPGKPLRILRRFSGADRPLVEQFSWRVTDSRISDASGKVVFEMKGVEVPEAWSQLAADILASKYLRRTGVPGTGSEHSAKQAVARIASSISAEGLRLGILDSAGAKIFEDEIAWLLLSQSAAFNSPVWFNLGLHSAYGIEGSSGSFRYDEEARAVVEVGDSYRHPQCSACFIQSVEDSLDSIFELLKSEARLFKYGSGTGTNFSPIRGKQESLSGGGASSGLMSFLEVLDRGAGATKSGGITRRAAKMVCLDVDHPEILDFIHWKEREEKKARALISAGYDSDFNGEAYKTVSGQNSNNSVRVSDEFIHAVLEDRNWNLTARTTGEVVATLPARRIWREIAEAAWASADPGLQFDTTINSWHTASGTDRIRASNPCSEFMFLDDTACNLASLNLLKFMDADGAFRWEDFNAAVRLMVIAQEILVSISSYPTREIAMRSHDFRPLGLGFANLGAILMVKGLPYDSEEARKLAAEVSARMTSEAYFVSAELAEVAGSFAGFPLNRKAMLGVLGRHEDAAKKAGMEGVSRRFREAMDLGAVSGFRNSQVTVLAPTGTIGLLMDCDTTGVEPDFSLVKFKKLSGGGVLKIANHSVSGALKTLGYSEPEREEILRDLLGSNSFPEKGAGLTREQLLLKGFQDADLDRIEALMPSCFDFSSLFSRTILGEECFRRLQIPEERSQSPGFQLLEFLGFTREEVSAAEEVLCGRLSLEGAPGLKPEHLSVFDCAVPSGRHSTRSIAPLGHLLMMAAIQPFLSGAISKTVNFPSESSVEEIEALHLMAWKLGLKSIAIYRDGSKASQPLNRGREGSRPEARSLAREALPVTRSGVVLDAKLGGRTITLRTGEYPDGRVGEVFVDLEGADSEYRALLNCFSVAVSLGLQFGVPLKEWVDRFAFTHFEPSGPISGHPGLKMATSVVDYVFRTLGIEYLGMQELSHVPGSGGLPRSVSSGDALEDQIRALRMDAPRCDSCGHSTVRNGSCFRCLNCGNSIGCS